MQIKLVTCRQCGARNESPTETELTRLFAEQVPPNAYEIDCDGCTNCRPEDTFYVVHLFDRFGRSVAPLPGASERIEMARQIRR